MEGVTYMFSSEQKKFMKSIGIPVNFDMLSDDDYVAIEESVSEYLQQHGFDKNYKPTEEGLMCESILDEL